MSPTKLVELIIIFGIAIGLILLALLFPEKGRKAVLVIAFLLILGGITFYSTRPFIVQHQTNEAIGELNKHLIKKYPNDKWSITDRDVIEIRPVVSLHVIFESEPKVVYEYEVKGKNIKQVHMFMSSGDSVEDTNIKPQHDEGGARGQKRTG